MMTVNMSTITIAAAGIGIARSFNHVLNGGQKSQEILPSLAPCYVDSTHHEGLQTSKTGSIQVGFRRFLIYLFKQHQCAHCNK